MARPARGFVPARRPVGASCLHRVSRRGAVMRVGLTWRGLVVRDGPPASWGAFWSGDCSFRAVSGMSPWFVGILVWLVPLVVRLWVLVLAG